MTQATNKALREYDDHYTVVAVAGQEAYGIRIEKGEFSGVVFTPENFREKSYDKETGMSELTFDYQINDPKTFDAEQLETNESFLQIVAKIILNLIARYMDKEQAETFFSDSDQVIDLKVENEPHGEVKE